MLMKYYVLMIMYLCLLLHIDISHRVISHIDITRWVIYTLFLYGERMSECDFVLEKVPFPEYVYGP